ncbi:MAG TPA: PhoU domain-containing protein [Verrucomicrobiae bacterium]|nr:PhoU domain-containing protein [Verrucomicrobiae bacterium]
MSLGRSSLVISLPKNWMQLNELKKGDVVSFAIQRDRSLVIYPGTKKKSETKETTLRIGPDEDDLLITMKIVGSYLNGYSGITLISEKVFSVPQIKAIRKTAGMLYMRIMESNSKGVYIQTLMDETKADLKQTVQRLHLISQSMGEDAVKSLKNKDVALAKAVFSLDDDVYHFVYFLLRVLRDAVQGSVLANEYRVDPLECMDYQTLVYMMRDVADNSAEVSRHVIMLDGIQQDIPGNVLELMVIAGNEALNLYVKAVDAFFSKDVAKSVEILRQREEIAKLDSEIAARAFEVKQKNEQLICAICSIRDSIKRIADCAASIARIAINREFSEST